MLPAKVFAASDATAALIGPAGRGAHLPSSIEIELAGARFRLRGAVDEVSLRSVLEALRE